VCSHEAEEEDEEDEEEIVYLNGNLHEGAVEGGVKIEEEHSRR
jgi:hypothetical protein